MRLLIFATHHDPSARSLYNFAKKSFISVTYIRYSHLSFIQGRLYNSRKKKPIEINREDKIIVRWPWDAEDISLEYSDYVQYLLLNHARQIILDRKCLQEHSPFYEDKLFQYMVFEKLDIPTPQTFHVQSMADLSSTTTYPCVLKKRISSRSKGNFMITSKKELAQHKKLDIKEYIIQEYFKAAHDYRVLILKDSLIGVTDRAMHTRQGGRLAVKGMKSVSEINPRIVTDALKIAKFLGADFLGVDVLEDEHGSYRVIEANLSPQFESFSKSTGIVVPPLVLSGVQEQVSRR